MTTCKHSQAGGRGDVVTKVLFVCGDCVEVKKQLAPLTKMSDYDRLPVCQIAFRRQFLLHQRKINDELIDCPEGCSEKIKQRHLSRHLENECVKRYVTCRREGCHARVRFCDLEHHERSTECQVYYRGDTMAVKARGRMEMTDCTLKFECGFRAWSSNANMCISHSLIHSLTLMLRNNNKTQVRWDVVTLERQWM